MGTNHQDAPPSYDSMFGELAQKHAESDGVVDFTKEAAGVVNKKVSGIAGLICCGVLCGLLGLAIPLTEIIIGSIYLNECPAERLLPIYLIVAGVFSMLSGSCTGGNRWASRNTDEGDDEETGGGTKAKTGGCCGSLVGFFVLIWFICGNVFVFRMQECDSTQSLSINSTSVDCFTKDEAFSTADFYCHKLVYNYVYYSTIVKWAICGAITTIMILVCCCCCCFKCFGSRQEGSADIQASAANNPSYSA